MAASVRKLVSAVRSQQQQQAASKRKLEQLAAERQRKARPASLEFDDVPRASPPPPALPAAHEQQQHPNKSTSERKRLVKGSDMVCAPVTEPQFDRCGTFGCILEDRHPGLHIFEQAPSRDRAPTRSDTSAFGDARPPQKKPRPKPSTTLPLPSPGERGANFPFDTVAHAQATVGRRIRLWWGGERPPCFYRGEITKINPKTGAAFVVYDDDDRKWHVRERPPWRVRAGL